MDVNQFRFPREITRKIRGRFGKKNKARGILVIVPRPQVKAVTIIEVRLIDEVDREVVGRLKNVYTAMHVFGAQRQMKLPVKLPDAGKLIPNAPIKRRDHANLMSL